MLYEGKCIICGKDFTSRHPQTKTCCKECSEENKRNYARKFQKDTRERRHSHLKMCKGCGKLFKGRKTQLFCTAECYLNHQEKKLPKNDLICEICHKPFKAVRNDSKYCGKVCRSVASLRRMREKKLIKLALLRRI